MENIANQIFTSGEVLCDGKHFTNCDFKSDVVLIFTAGSTDVEFVGCRFGKRIVCRVPRVPDEDETTPSSAAVDHPPVEAT